jgi:hypothetical protein
MNNPLVLGLKMMKERSGEMEIVCCVVVKMAMSVRPEQHQARNIRPNGGL